MAEKQREIITAWVTRYALTSGIDKIQAEVCADISDSMITEMVPVGGRMTPRVSFHGNDWHRTREAAIARADEMRRKKIASVKKQLDKLQALDFTKAPE